MKAERHHQLQTNTLATKLVQLPDLGKIYGRRIAFAVIIIVLSGLLGYEYWTRAQAKAVAITTNMANARSLVDKLAEYPLVPFTIKPGPASEARKLLEDVMAQSKDRKVLAQALVLQGDLDWNMAQVPMLSLEPEDQPDRPPADLKNMARDSYQQVLDKYPEQSDAVTAARFGLAAIAENDASASSDKDKFADPRLYYQQIMATPGIREDLASLAEARLQMLDQVARAPRLRRVAERHDPAGHRARDPGRCDHHPSGHASAAATRSTTREAAESPASRPAIAPSPRPHAAVVRPATEPATKPS